MTVTDEQRHNAIMAALNAVLAENLSDIQTSDIVTISVNAALNSLNGEEIWKAENI